MASQEKIDDLVNFPVEGLDMQPYIVREMESGETAIYDLYGVSNHMGSLHGGHYVAHAFNHMEKAWYVFNDTSVSPMHGSTDNLVCSSAYLLFYRLR